MKKIAELGASVSVRALVFAQQLASKYDQFPRQRAVMLASAGVTFGALICSEAALAEGWAGMVEKGADQGDRIKKGAAKLLAVVGFFAGGTGAWNWYKKGSEGDRSDIKAKQIFVPIAAGAALGAVAYLLDRTGETVGISPSEYGQV
jgi:hypothetical protein